MREPTLADVCDLGGVLNVLIGGLVTLTVTA